jgi:transglutaminase-like putative cysteine protease
MSRLRILHSTCYRYAEPVEFGLHRLVVRPREGHDLQVERLALRVQPAATLSWHRDLFGNSVAFAHFSDKGAALEIENEVVVIRRDHPPHERLWELIPVRLPVSYSPLEAAVAQGYQALVYAGETEALRAWVEASFRPQQGMDAIDLVRRMTAWIHANITYRRREDRGVQSPLETLDAKTGSCRDTATLMLEAVRCAGLAARFASGYLDNRAAVAGRAATHAWTEIYFPDHGWFGCDPTLGGTTTLEHIVTGVSAHPRGVMPVSGTYAGPPGVYLGMSVAVRIERLEPVTESVVGEQDGKSEGAGKSGA